MQGPRCTYGVRSAAGRAGAGAKCAGRLVDEVRRGSAEPGPGCQGPRYAGAYRGRFGYRERFSQWTGQPERIVQAGISGGQGGASDDPRHGLGQPDDLRVRRRQRRPYVLRYVGECRRADTRLKHAQVAAEDHDVRVDDTDHVVEHPAEDLRGLCSSTACRPARSRAAAASASSPHGLVRVRVDCLMGLLGQTHQPAVGEQLGGARRTTPGSRCVHTSTAARSDRCWRARSRRRRHGLRGRSHRPRSRCSRAHAYRRDRQPPCEAVLRSSTRAAWSPARWESLAIPT